MCADLSRAGASAPWPRAEASLSIPTFHLSTQNLLCSAHVTQAFSTLHRRKLACERPRMRTPDLITERLQMRLPYTR